MTCESVANGLFGRDKAGHENLPTKSKAPVGSAKIFRSYDMSQVFLLPPSIDDWLPEDHAARFISEVVEELLDLDGMYASYVEASGAPPYDPKMLLKLVL